MGLQGHVGLHIQGRRQGEVCAAVCPGPATMTPSVLSAGSKIIPKGAGMRPTIGEAFYPPYGFSGLEI